jgi:large conductance mechanosensitive channel
VELFTTAALNPTMAELGIDSINSWPAGNLLVALLNFVVVAAVVFVVVKSVERLKHRTAKADPAAESQKQLAQAVERLSAALEERRL